MAKEKCPWEDILEDAPKLKKPAFGAWECKECNREFKAEQIDENEEIEKDYLCPNCKHQLTFAG